MAARVPKMARGALKMARERLVASAVAVFQLQAGLYKFFLPKVALHPAMGAPKAGIYLHPPQHPPNTPPILEVHPPKN